MRKESTRKSRKTDKSSHDTTAMLKRKVSEIKTKLKDVGEKLLVSLVNTMSCKNALKDTIVGVDGKQARSPLTHATTDG